MIKVKKNLNNVPDILTLNPKIGKSRKEVFDKNKEASKYIDKGNSYKVSSIQKELYKIYNKKCAYCEDSLLNAPKHIEHYRPKDIYYWLAYSWDNLLLCCTSCNSKKSNNFKIKNEQVNYNNEKFEDIHTLRDDYDKIEEPFIINPEKDDILSDIIFNDEAKISSNNKKVHYTIEEACNLNRDQLLEKRIKIFNTFKQNIEAHYEIFKTKQDITRFLPDIENFIKNCKQENDFYSFRYFIIHNIDKFFKGKLKIIIEKIVKKNIIRK